VLLWATWPTLATWAQPAPPFLIFALGSAVGFAVSLASASARGETRVFLQTPPRTLLLVAGGLLVNNVLYLMAMPRIGPAEANVISYLWPILLVLIASRRDRSRLARGQWLGIGAAFAGASLAIGPTFAKGFDPVGVLLAFASGVTFAVYAAVRSRGQEQRDVIGPSMGLMAVLAMGLHLAFETTPQLAWPQLLAIAAIGVAPLTLSNALWDRASRTGQLATLSGLAYLTPLVGLLLLALFGAAEVSWGTAAGAGLIVAGALAASRTKLPGL
jgi:drug/metabolite transporter (DMT)-like permease